MERWVVRLLESIPEGLFDLERLSAEEELVGEDADGDDGLDHMGEDLTRALVVYRRPR